MRKALFALAGSALLFHLHTPSPGIPFAAEAPTSSYMEPSRNRGPRNQRQRRKLIRQTPQLLNSKKYR